MGQHTVVLLSGGIDSSTAITECQTTDSTVSGLFVDYGQPAAQSEWEAAQRIANHYGVLVTRIELGASLISDDGEYFGRNAMLILVAAAITEARPLTVVIGSHALTPYYDTTPLFSRHMQRLLDGYSAGAVSLKVPFLSDTKSDIIRIAEARGVPLSATYSCERRNAPPCEQCPSCEDRRTIDAV